jgi:uncharacterized protein YjdB
MFKTKGIRGMLPDEIFTMGTMQSRKRELIVDSGNVNCPSSGDVSIEYCLDCPFLVEANLNGTHSSITCRR